MEINITPGTNPCTTPYFSNPKNKPGIPKNKIGIPLKPWKNLPIENATAGESGRPTLTFVKYFDGVRVAADGFRMYIERGDFIEASLPGDLTYPDWEPIVPKGPFSCSAKINTFDLWKRVRTAAIISYHLNVIILGGKITIASSQYDLGEIVVSADCESKGDAEFWINAKYFLDACQWLGKIDVEISQRNNGGPILFVAGNKTAVIMPMHKPG
jgi:DNA polymerase III sliding clamp (beta) subunit (PCNA family)